MRQPLRQVAYDMKIILSEAEAAGTLHRLKTVGIYFDEEELRAIVRASEVLNQIADGYLGDQTAEAQFKWAQDMARNALGPPTQLKRG